MDNFKNIDEILDFAIKREEESRDFYLQLAEKMERPEMEKVFKNFANEELGHKKKIEAVKNGEYVLSETKEPMWQMEERGSPLLIALMQHILLRLDRSVLVAMIWPRVSYFLAPMRIVLMVKQGYASLILQIPMIRKLSVPLMIP